MAVRMKQTLEQDVVAFCKSPLELRKPMVRNGRDGFCFSQHSHAHVIDLRGVSRLHNLHHLSRAERGVMDGTPVYRLDDALHRVVLCLRQLSPRRRAPIGFSTRMPGVPTSGSTVAGGITARPRHATLRSTPTASIHRTGTWSGNAGPHPSSTTTRRASMGTSGV